MRVSIIGAAGHVGSSAALNIAIHKLADELVMISGRSKERLEQFVYDLSSAVTGLDVVVQRGEYDDLRGSDVVIIAAGSADMSGPREELLKVNVALIREFGGQIKRYCPNAIVIMATNPVDPLNYGLYQSARLDRKRLIGYSGNDSLRFRMFLAKALGVNSSQVQAVVIGEHGATQVPLFSSVRVGGRPVTIGEEIKFQVRREAARQSQVLESLRIKTGRTSAWATSMGLAAMCRAVRFNTGELMGCSAVLEGEYGYRGLSMGVPVRIGKDGICEIQELVLEPDEKKALADSASKLRRSMEYVDGLIGTK